MVEYLVTGWLVVMQIRMSDLSIEIGDGGLVEKANGEVRSCEKDWVGEQCSDFWLCGCISIESGFREYLWGHF